MIYWEDFKAGDRIEMGRHTFTEAEIIDFARQFDPQPFHTDPQAAKQSFFGGLVASGWHTCSVGMRLSVDYYINRTVQRYWAEFNAMHERVKAKMAAKYPGVTTDVDIAF